MTFSPLVTVEDYANAARAALDPATFAYFDGGSGRELTSAANRTALDSHRLQPRVLCALPDVSTSTALFGRAISMPVILAPVAFLSLAHDDGELGAAEAARATGTMLCVSPFSTTPLDEIAAALGDAGWWMQTFIFKDRGVTDALVDVASGLGSEALIVTVDQPGRIAPRPRERRAGFTLPAGITLPVLETVLGPRRGVRPFEAYPAPDAAASWNDVAMLAERSRVPLLVKGVLSARDAKLAHASGAAGVIVSNHGGRQLDGAVGTAEVLEEIVDAVPAGFTVLVDGGIRSGADVVKMLAAGASATLIGRPLIWALATGGCAAVTAMLTTLRKDVEDTLAFCGVATPENVTRELLFIARG